RRGRRGGARGVGVAALVAGGVERADAVGVARPGADARVVVRGAGGGRDLGEVAAPGAGAALDVVAGDADVVGRGAPGEIDVGARDGGRGQRPGRRRRRGVGRGRDRARGVGVGALVAGGVERADAVGVVPGGADAGVLVGGPRGS